MYVCPLNDCVCTHAARITECSSIWYKNNCAQMSVCTNVQIVSVCMCVCVLRARGHRRIKRRQKDEHLVGIRENGGMTSLNKWRGATDGGGRVTHRGEDAEGREGAGRQKRWGGDGQRRRGRLEKTMGILILPLG